MTPLYACAPSLMMAQIWSKSRSTQRRITSARPRPLIELAWRAAPRFRRHVSDGLGERPEVAEHGASSAPAFYALAERIEPTRQGPVCASATMAVVTAIGETGHAGAFQEISAADCH